MVQVNALIQKELEKGILDVDTHTPSDLTAFKVLTHLRIGQGRHHQCSGTMRRSLI